MLTVGDKEADAIYYVDEQGIEKEVAEVWLGDQKVWPEESDEPNIHIIGKFPATVSADRRYVYINGKEISLDEEFDYESDEIWRYGINEKNSSPWFSNVLKSLYFLSDISQITILSRIFTSLSMLNFLDLGDRFDTKEVTEMKYVFSGCSSLPSLNLGNKFDMGNVTDAVNMFNDCSKLTTVTGKISNIKVSLDLHYSPLTADSAMVFINGLSDEVTGQTLTFKSTTYNSLTPEQLAVGTAKGWTIASA